MTSLNFGIRQSELPWGKAGRDAPADVTRILQEVKALGANSISMDCLWIQLDPNRKAHGDQSKYVWTDLDYAVNAAEAAGLDINLNIEPRRSILPVGVTASQAMATDYGLMCGAIAQRYASSSIRWIECGNEVNDIANFGAPSTPSKYLWFLRAANTAIKPYMPTVTVLAGALMAVGTGWASLAPVEWVKAFYDSNPQDAFDGISVHPYMRDNNFGVQTPTADNFSFKNINAIRALMDANGDSAKLIYCTEWGFETMTTVNGISTTDAELEAEQAANLAAQWALMQPYADAGIIYPTTWLFMYRDWEQPNKKANNHYGIVHNDYTKKPGWTFVRSLAGEVTSTPPVAAVVATAWDPTVTVVEDATKIYSGTATVTATAWDPDVIGPITPPTATVVATAWAPTVEIVAGAEYVSTGTGSRDTTVANDKTITVTHTTTSVSGGGLYVGVVASTTNSKPWELYTALTVTSSIDGALTRIGSRHIASSSNKAGSVHWFGIHNPTAGAHTLTCHVAQTTDFVTTFDAVAADSVFVRGESGLANVVVAAGSSSGGNTPMLSISTGPDDFALLLFGGSKDFNTHFAGGTIRYHAGSNLTAGNGDYILIATQPGPSVTGDCTGLGLTLYGALALDIPAA